MTTAARLTALAASIAQATADTVADFSVHPEPRPPSGTVYAFCDAPTFRFEAAARTYCPGTRPPRIAVNVQVIGAGTAPGQLLALADVVGVILPLLDDLSGWLPDGDTTPGTFGDLPAFTVPLIST